MKRVAVCDTNVWLALALSEHRHHQAARDWLDGVEARASIVFCRSTQQSFLRLLTNPAVLGAFGNVALTNRQAWQMYEAFLWDDRICFQAGEPAGLEERWRKLAALDQTSPKLWMDAYLAAFALAGGYRLVTLDTAYRQFPDLDLEILRGEARAT